MDAAAHSRSELMAISRPMMTSTGTTMAGRLMGAGGELASSMSAVDTMSLSATGSRKAPNSVVMFHYGRRKDGMRTCSQSVEVQLFAGKVPGAKTPDNF